METPQIVKTIQNLINEVRALEAERPRFVFPFTTEVYKEITVEASHLLPNHQAKCQFLHGHSYKIGVTLRSKLWDKQGTPKEGMAIDFKDIKSVLKSSVDCSLDHAYINDVLCLTAPYIDEGHEGKVLFLRTTAEQMAWWIFVQLAFDFEVNPMYKRDRHNKSKHLIEVVQVDVWETTTSRATAKREYYSKGLLEETLKHVAYPDLKDYCEDCEEANE